MRRFAFSFLAILFSVSNAFAEKTKIALDWKAEPEFGGFYAAELGGHFKKNGVEAEIVEGGAGAPVLQMVSAGKIDFGTVSADELVIARSKGQDIVALFATFQKNPHAFMAHPERGFKSIGDMYKADGTIALQTGQPYAIYLKKKFDPVKAKLVPYTGGITNFLADKKHSQQCFWAAEPLVAQQKGLKPTVFLVADEGYNPYTTVLVTRGEVLKKNPKLVKSLVDSVRAGWREYLDKPQAANKKMSELNKSMELAIMEKGAETQKALIETPETAKAGLGSMTIERWSQLADQLMDLKLITKKPAPEQMFTNL